MSAHDTRPDDERLVRALEEGPLGEANLRRERPELVARLNELQALARELDEARHSAEYLRGIGGPAATSADRELVERFVRGRVAARPGRSFRRLGLLLAASVIAILGFVVWNATRQPATPDRVLLGSSGVTIVSSSPRGEIEWSSAGSRYLVRIERVAPVEGETNLLFERKQAETRWSPTDEQRAAWPDRVRLHVFVLSDSGQPTSSYASLELSLSSESSR